MAKGKSRRNKVISLTRTKKQGRILKEKIVARIQRFLKKYKYCFVFKHQNMTTAPFREI